MTPAELGDMEPREFINKMIGASEMEMERRLWHAWVITSNNPNIKEKPGTFSQFCERMTSSRKKTVKMKPETFFRILGINE